MTRLLTTTSFPRTSRNRTITRSVSFCPRFHSYTVYCRLKAAGFNITHIWSSPYRRCLQTAAAAARELGVGSISVHHGLSEGTSSAISCANSVGVDPEFIRSGAEPMYLKPEGKVAAVGDGIAVVDVDVGHYCDEAIEGGAFARFKSAFTDVRRAHSTTEGAGDVLIVTHWEGVAVAGALLSEAPVRVTNVEFCGVIAADAAMSRVVHAHRVNMLKRTGKY